MCKPPISPPPWLRLQALKKKQRSGAFGLMASECSKAQTIPDSESLLAFSLRPRFQAVGLGCLGFTGVRARAHSRDAGMSSYYGLQVWDGFQLRTRMPPRATKCLGDLTATGSTTIALIPSFLYPSYEKKTTNPAATITAAGGHAHAT